MPRVGRQIPRGRWREDPFRVGGVPGSGDPGTTEFFMDGMPVVRTGGSAEAWPQRRENG